MASSDVFVLLVYKQTFVSGSVKEVFWPVVADQEARISGVHCVRRAANLAESRPLASLKYHFGQINFSIFFFCRSVSQARCGVSDVTCLSCLFFAANYRNALRFHGSRLCRRLFKPRRRQVRPPDKIRHTASRLQGAPTRVGKKGGAVKAHAINKNMRNGANPESHPPETTNPGPGTVTIITVFLY